MIVNQYDVIIVNLDPIVGSEIKKTRPCLVISPNEINHNLRTIIIAPITSKNKSYPTRVHLNLKNEDNWVVIDQIRTIDKKRILRTVSTISIEKAKMVKEVIKETFVD